VWEDVHQSLSTNAITLTPASPAKASDHGSETSDFYGDTEDIEETQQLGFGVKAFREPEYSTLSRTNVQGSCAVPKSPFSFTFDNKDIPCIRS